MKDRIHTQNVPATQGSHLTIGTAYADDGRLCVVIGVRHKDEFYCVPVSEEYLDSVIEDIQNARAAVACGTPFFVSEVAS